jgi:hypothetical protein
MLSLPFQGARDEVQNFLETQSDHQEEGEHEGNQQGWGLKKRCSSTSRHQICLQENCTSSLHTSPPIAHMPQQQLPEGSEFCVSFCASSSLADN